MAPKENGEQCHVLTWSTTVILYCHTVNGFSTPFHWQVISWKYLALPLSLKLSLNIALLKSRALNSIQDHNARQNTQEQPSTTTRNDCGGEAQYQGRWSAVAWVWWRCIPGKSYVGEEKGDPYQVHNWWQTCHTKEKDPVVSSRVTGSRRAKPMLQGLQWNFVAWRTALLW